MQLWKQKNDKIRKVVKDKVQEITVAPKSFKMTGVKIILQVVTKLCGIQKR